MILMVYYNAVLHVSITHNFVTIIWKVYVHYFIIVEIRQKIKRDLHQISPSTILTGVTRHFGARQLQNETPSEGLA